jgi:photosystem II stability/assembly factor-like uncharacterized protein
LDDTSRSGSLLFGLSSKEAWLLQFLEGGMQKVATALYKTEDGGASWVKLRDYSTDSSILGFDKTDLMFIDPQYGWLTRFFRGVAAYLSLEITEDGGVTWRNLDMPAPPDDPDIFADPEYACGLYDPYLRAVGEGSVRLSCSYFAGETKISKNFLYQTIDGGETWDIQFIPGGELHFLGGQTFYAAGQEIYRTDDGGENWGLVKSVNWEGQFSFIDADNALAVAYDPDDEEYALVRTRDGCKTFEIITPELLPSQSKR